MTLPYLYLRDAFQFPPYFKTFLLLGMFCVNKVSKKFSTTGGEGKEDGGYLTEKKEIVDKKKRKTIIFH